MPKTKNAILERLLPGDLRMKGASEEVVEYILSNPRELANLIACMEVDNPALRMRCCDAMEKLSRTHPEWFQKYKTQLIKISRQSDQKEVRWHMSQIVPRLLLTHKQRIDAYNTFRSYLNDRSSIVKTFAMQALTDLAMQQPSLIEQTRTLVKQLARQGTPAMKSRSKQLLKVLA